MTLSRANLVLWCCVAIVLVHESNLRLVQGFAPTVVVDTLHSMQHSALALPFTLPYNSPISSLPINGVSVTATSSSIATMQAHALAAIETYQRLLVEHALPTKMATGATLAVAGDAIAQSTQARANQAVAAPTGTDISSFSYDVPRAASFAVFDGCYRALQHVAFPFLTTNLQGQVLGGFVTNVMLLATSFMAPMESLNVATLSHAAAAAAALEQTLASQLIIVPFLYYPAFFCLTGTLQGLTVDACLQRAQTTFVPLMQRNLVFWIPVQFVQFAVIPTEWQIGFLSCAGLAWTVILSLFAGSAKPAAAPNAVSSTDKDVATMSSSLSSPLDARAVVSLLETTETTASAMAATTTTLSTIQVVDIPNQRLKRKTTELQRELVEV